MHEAASYARVKVEYLTTDQMRNEWARDILVFWTVDD